MGGRNMAGKLGNGRAEEEGPPQNLRCDLCLTMYLENRAETPVSAGGTGFTHLWSTHKHQHRLVKRFPKAQEHGPVQVAPVAAELQHGHVPFLNVGVRLGLVVLQMKGPNWRGTRRQINLERTLNSLVTKVANRTTSKGGGIAMVTTHFWQICRRGSRRAAATASP